MGKYSGNIVKTAVTMATSNESLIFAVFVIYMLHVGLSITDVSLVISVWLLLSTLGQIPAGVFADRYGHKLSMMIGTFISLIGAILFAFSSSLLWFLVAYGLRGFGMAMIGGADMAMLYESLHKDGKEKEFKKTVGKVELGVNLFAVIASIIGGVLYAVISPQAPFLVEIGIAAIAFLSTILLKNVEVKPTKKHVQKQIKEGMSYAFTKKKFSKVFIFSALIGSISITTFQYLQPLYKSVEIPVAYFGLIGAGAFLLKGLGSWYSDKLGKVFTIDHYLVLHGTVFSLFLILIQRLGTIPLVLGTVAVMFFLRGLYSPTVNTFINDHVTSDKRATMLSTNSQLLFLTSSISLFGVGYLADTYDLGTAFFGISVLSMVLLTLYVLVLRKVKVE